MKGIQLCKQCNHPIHLRSKEFEKGGKTMILKEKRMNLEFIMDYE